MLKRLTFTIAGIFLIAIAGCAGLFTETRVDLDCGNFSEMTFEDWQSWTKVNTSLLPSAGHGDHRRPPYVDVFVDDLAKDIYQTASAPYPECARIIKAKYKDETGQEFIDLAIMVKMPAGYDPENNDWWYGHADSAGSQIKDQEMDIETMFHDCGFCHQNAPDQDFLFSTEVLNAIDE